MEIVEEILRDEGGGGEQAGGADGRHSWDHWDKVDDEKSAVLDL